MPYKFLFFVVLRTESQNPSVRTVRPPPYRCTRGKRSSKVAVSLAALVPVKGLLPPPSHTFLTLSHSLRTDKFCLTH